MAADAYLQIDGTKGESADSGHQVMHDGGGNVQDEIGLCFSKVKWSYTQQRIGGGGAGGTAGGWDLACRNSCA